MGNGDMSGMGQKEKINRQRKDDQEGAMSGNLMGTGISVEAGLESDSVWVPYSLFSQLRISFDPMDTLVFS